MRTTKKQLKSMGLGMSPRPAHNHQRIIKNLIVRLTLFLDQKWYEALPEVEVGSVNSPAPDVVVFSVQNFTPLIAIEVTNNSGGRLAVENCVKVLKRYKLGEAFIYNYQLKKWYRVYEDELVMYDESYSNILQKDLSEFDI